MRARIRSVGRELGNRGLEVEGMGADAGGDEEHNFFVRLA